jgi:pimeloyl-ACP methyl ester carboxylesterase
MKMVDCGFSEKIEALERAMPCVLFQVVDTGSFVDPAINARQVRDLVAEIDRDLGRPVPLHLLGYSQGARNALQTLSDNPEIAARARSVLTLNSAARGSEVAALLFGPVSHLEGPVDCRALPAFAIPTCEFANLQSPQPSQFLVELIAFAMAVMPDMIEDFIAAEEAIAPAQKLSEFLLKHAAGVYSLMPESAAACWADDAEKLPKHVLYGPLAEANHWQWELATGAMPESAMPAAMSDRIQHRELLLAYSQTLYEMGVLLADASRDG